MGEGGWLGRGLGMLVLLLACSYRPLPLADEAVPVCASRRATGAADTGGCQTPCGASEICDAGICRSRLTEFPLGPPSMAGPFKMSVGQEDLWVSSLDAAKIVRVTPAGETRGYPTDAVDPWCLTVGPDGNVWFASWRNVERMTPEGVITRFPLPPVPLGGVTTIVSGPDGNLWYGDYLGQRIGRMTPEGVLTEFPTSSLPYAMAAGGGGNLWFVDGAANVVGRVTPDGNITVFPLAGDASTPVFVAAGPDGNVWATVHERQNRPPVGKIVRLTPTGAITEFLLPGGSTPGGITAGPDCNLWFTEAEARLGRISPTGTITEFPLPAGTVPQAIVTGSDGNLWFTEASGRIGRFVPP